MIDRVRIWILPRLRSKRLSLFFKLIDLFTLFNHSQLFSCYLFYVEFLIFETLYFLLEIIIGILKLPGFVFYSLIFSIERIHLSQLRCQRIYGYRGQSELRRNNQESRSYVRKA